MSVIRKYSFAWVTIGFLILSLVGHWVFGWLSYVNEQTMHAAPIEMSAFLMAMLRDTFENWQSEFLQLLWQVVGLTLLLHVGSPQSKDSEDRSEAKLDEILRRVDPEGADRTLAVLSRKYPDH
jgi:hypothetical protein